MSNRYFDKDDNTGIRHLFNATVFSLRGVKQAYARESAFRQELLLFSFVLPSGVYLAVTVAEVVALMCACLLVLALELLNSGIEAAIDRISVEHHEMSGLAKDYGSAAVMMALIIMFTIWGYIIYNGTNRL